MEPIAEPHRSCWHPMSHCLLVIESAPRMEGWRDGGTDRQQGSSESAGCIRFGEKRPQGRSVLGSGGPSAPWQRMPCPLGALLPEVSAHASPTSAGFLPTEGRTGIPGRVTPHQGPTRAPGLVPGTGHTLSPRQGHDPAGTGIMPRWFPLRRRVPAEDVDRHLRPGRSLLQDEI